MELRDLLVVDADLLSAAQAKQVTRDVIDVLSSGAPAEDQPQLRSLLIAAQEIATGRKVGDNRDTMREEVLRKIQDAEARGARREATNVLPAIWPSPCLNTTSLLLILPSRQ